MAAPNLYEPYRALTWLQSVLTPLATGGAWHGVASVSAQAPFIVYSLQAGNDLAVVGAERIWNDGVYQVKVCGPATSEAQLASVADAVDNALQRQGGINIGATGSGGTMLSCTREQTLIVPEIVNGVPWLNIIGIYRIYVQAR